MVSSVSNKETIVCIPMGFLNLRIEVYHSVKASLVRIICWSNEGLDYWINFNSWNQLVLKVILIIYSLFSMVIVPIKPLFNNDWFKPIYILIMGCLHSFKRLLNIWVETKIIHSDKVLFIYFIYSKYIFIKGMYNYRIKAMIVRQYWLMYQVSLS